MSNDGPLFILAGNGPYENRGCEAIVRGTVKILRERYKNPKFICLSHFRSDQQYWKQRQEETDKSIVHLAARGLNRKEVVHSFYKPKTWSRVFWHFFNPDNLYPWVYGDLDQYYATASAILSIGGDNYAIDEGEVPRHITAIDDIAYDHGKPIIIWGASVGPFSAMPDYERYMRDHLSKVTGIFARESATIEYLKSIGVTKNVYQVSDPAFQMEPLKPRGIEEGMSLNEDAIGINLSPLMAKFINGRDLEQWTKISASIIELIAKRTEMPIYLIPHVTTAGSSDYEFMVNVLSLVSKEARNVKLVPPIYNAAETKWIIGHMTIFAGARLHSTIAAFSSEVPTLSLAYSMKARGISKDIYGHSEYCLDPSELNAKVVSDRILTMLDRDTSIRRELNERIPIFKRLASNSGVELQKILINNDDSQLSVDL